LASDRVGAIIKRLRKERGLTQGQLATYAKVTRSWVSLVELGRREKPEREILERVASVLRVAPEILLAAAGYRIGPMPPPEERSLEQILAEAQAVLRRQREEEERRRREEAERIREAVKQATDIVLAREQADLASFVNILARIFREETKLPPEQVQQIISEVWAKRREQIEQRVTEEAKKRLAD